MNHTRFCLIPAILFLNFGFQFFSGASERLHPVDSTGGIMTLDTVKVTSGRIPASAAKSARIVTVIDSSTISSMPVESVNDLLKYAAGVDVRQRGDMGAQTDISVRGGTSDQVAVFLDGINICDPQTGHNAVDFPVDINDIDRIEILSGPAGTAYGASSLLGALNIVTKKPSETGLSAHVEGGSFGFFNGGIGFSSVAGNVANSVSAGYLRSDGFSRSISGKLNSDYKTAKAFWHGCWKSETVDVFWHAGLSVRDFGSNTFYSAKYDDQFEHTFKTFAALSAQTHGRIKFRPAVYWNRSQDRFELIRDNPEAVPFNHHRTSVWGVNLNSWVETVIGKTAFGAEMRNEDILSTNLGETLSSPKKIPGTSDTTYVKGLNRTAISIFLEHSVEFGGFTASAGAAAVKNTGNEDDFKIYPGVNAAFRFAGDWKVYASYNSSLRMPTFTELYYSVGGHKADRNLKAEKMQSVEAALRFSKPWINAVATVYYNHGTDMIDWIRDLSEGDDAPWKSVNYTKINSFGQEFSLRLDFRSLLLRDNFPVKTMDLSYSHIHQDKDIPSDIQSKYALEYLRHKVVARADFHIWRGLDANASWRWQDRVGNYEVYESLVASGRLESYKPYSLVDARVSWNSAWRRHGLSAAEGGRIFHRTPVYDIYIEINNVLDKEYYDYGNIPQPGIMIRAGLAISL